MTERCAHRQVAATAISEGAGVTVYRTIGTSVLRHLDPFLMLDFFNSEDPDDYIAGFPSHPHRGFVTLTYMLDGHMEHQDSMGNTGDLCSGGAQWMKAASGVIHSEMPKQSDGRMRGFQLWINLPAAEKMTDPAYQEYTATAIPRLQSEAHDVRLLAGEYAGQHGPVRDPHTRVQYLDVSLPARHSFHHRTGEGVTAFAYLFEGDLGICGKMISSQCLAVLGPGDEVTLQAGENGARFLLVSGAPLGEPIVQHGPFVMNSREEIEQAIHDYRNNTLVRKKAGVTTG